MSDETKRALDAVFGGFEVGKRAGRIEMAEEILKAIKTKYFELYREKEFCCAATLEGLNEDIRQLVEAEKGEK